MLYLREIRDPILVILLICSVISIAFPLAFPNVPEERYYKFVIFAILLHFFCSWSEGLAIFITVNVVAGVISFNNWRKETKFRLLYQRNQDVPVKAIRNGVLQIVSVVDIVVGDIVELEQGDKVPADGVLVEAFGVHVDESSFTGETEPVEKTCTEDAYLIASTTIVEGKCTMLVTRVGAQSIWGGLLHELNKQAVQMKDTPLGMQYVDYNFFKRQN